MDNLPTVIMEAMSARLPVISTPLGGIPEMIEHEINGELVPEHDPAAICAAMERLIADPARAKVRRPRAGDGARKILDRSEREKALHFALALVIHRVRNGEMNLLPRVLCGAALFLVTAATSSADSWVDTYNRLLGKYVTSGGVKYAEWKGNAADVQALQTVVDAIAKENV